MWKKYKCVEAEGKNVLICGNLWWISSSVTSDYFGGFSFGQSLLFIY